MLRKIGEHDILISLVGTKDVTGWFDDISTQGSQGCDHGFPVNDFVTKTTTGLAGITNGILVGVGLVGNQIVRALENVQFGEDAQLHGGTGLFAALSAVTPNGQRGISLDFCFKAAAHARPSVSCHGLDCFGFGFVWSIVGGSKKVGWCCEL